MPFELKHLKLGTTPEDLTEQIRDRYDGFSFDGETRVYNPFSTLGFFTHQRFDNFWVKSGSISFIREFLVERKTDGRKARYGP